jgi:hypothetical protein
MPTQMWLSITSATRASPVKQVQKNTTLSTVEVTGVSKTTAVDCSHRRESKCLSPEHVVLSNYSILLTT